MEFFFNELSFDNQFQGVHDFEPALQTIWQCKELVEKFGFRLYCQRAISNRLVFNNVGFAQAVTMTGRRDLIRIIMAWVSKHGPFMEETQEHSTDDYLYLKYNDDIVTDYSLGEAAYRIATDRQAGTVSIKPSDFELTPIPVIWHESTAEQLIEVPNFWELNPLEKYLSQQQAPILSWAELLRRADMDFPNLKFLDSVSAALEGEAFSSVIADRVMIQLDILNQLAICFDDQGQRTTTGHELIKNYFQGDRAIFSDESESNKQKFEREMIFGLPNRESIFCPFHGKISYRVFRLHFSWPIQHNTPVYIAYIGPKITKK